MTRENFMKTISWLKLTLAIFSLMMAFNLGVFAQKTDCSKTTDEEIVNSIYDKIKVKYEDQIPHINVRIKDGVVTMEGWVTTKSIRKEIEKLAKKTKCVKKVVNNLTIGVSGGCGQGQKKCGEICIDANDECNIGRKG